ncbi:MAG: hypothetical protein AB7E36_09985 [Salinivirgaceae bacterium]
MCFSISLNKLIENYPKECFQIGLRVIEVENLGINFSTFWELKKLDDSKRFLELVEKSEYNDIEIKAFQLLNEYGIHSFFVDYILPNHWHGSYKFREEFFTWVVNEISKKIPKSAYSLYEYNVIEEFDFELKKKLNNKEYSFIPDDNIVFNLPFIPDDEIPKTKNYLYCLSRYLERFGKTANVGQFYTSCKELLFGKIGSPSSMIFELEAKLYLHRKLVELDKKLCK